MGEKKHKTLPDIVRQFRPGISREEAVKIATKLSACRSSMISRCCNPESKDYPGYGGRGIAICPEWLDKEHGSEAFVRWALCSGWKPGLSIDRRNNDEGYSPENCRWASKSEQANNTRRSQSMQIDLPRCVCRDLTGCNGVRFGRLWRSGPDAIRNTIIHHRGLQQQREATEKDNLLHARCPYCREETTEVYRREEGEIVGCPHCIRRQDIFGAATDTRAI